MQSTMTRQQTVERVERLIREALTQLPKHAEPKIEHQTDNFPCDDPSDGGPRGRIIVERDYWIRNLDQQDYPQYFETLRRHWESLGYRKYRDDGKPLGTVVYEDNEGFEVIFQLTGDKKILVLAAASPCVWPNGTPEPETE